MKDIYKLKLHEAIYTEDYRILRVPGGFIYTILKQKDAYKESAWIREVTHISSVFVPFDNEFREDSYVAGLE